MQSDVVNFVVTELMYRWCLEMFFTQCEGICCLTYADVYYTLCPEKSNPLDIIQ